MPFKSRAQEKWAFSTHQKFAKKWADMTDQKSLPQRKRQKKNTQYKRDLRRLGLKNKKGMA